MQSDPVYLLVEYTVALVNIRDVPLVFVEAFAREFAFLVDTSKHYQHAGTEQRIVENILAIHFTDDTIDGILTWLAVGVQKAVSIAIEILGGELLLLASRHNLYEFGI
jgi:hypothetical protein